MTPEENHLVDKEKQYRMYYLKADINLSSLVILVWLVTVVIFIPVDFQALGATERFYLFLAARLIFIVGGIAVFLGLRRTTEPIKYDRFISLIMFMAVIFFILGSRILAHDYVGQLIMNVLVIISIYAVIPGPILTKIIACVMFSIESIFTLYQQEQTPLISKQSILMGIIITNLLGFYSWNFITQFRHRQFQTHMELQEAKQHAELLARTDPLTETSNRRAFMEQGCEEFSRARRYQRLLSLVLIDIDNFKSINDQYGHQGGDLVLNKFSHLVNKQIREQDVLGRIGGDEFGLLLPETTLEEAQVIITRICETFRQTTIEFQDKLISTSFSAGLVTAQPSDQSFEQLLQRTDQKLYQAKKTGKDRIEI